MAVTLEVTNEEITAYLSGEIDHHSAVELRRRIDESVLSGTPERLILDFSGVTFMDSSGRLRRIFYHSLHLSRMQSLQG